MQTARISLRLRHCAAADLPSVRERVLCRAIRPFRRSAAVRRRYRGHFYYPSCRISNHLHSPTSPLRRALSAHLQGSSRVYRYYRRYPHTVQTPCHFRDPSAPPEYHPRRHARRTSAYPMEVYHHSAYPLSARRCPVPKQDQLSCHPCLSQLAESRYRVKTRANIFSVSGAMPQKHHRRSCRRMNWRRHRRPSRNAHLLPRRIHWHIHCRIHRQFFYCVRHTFYPALLSLLPVPISIKIKTEFKS